MSNVATQKLPSRIQASGNKLGEGMMSLSLIQDYSSAGEEKEEEDDEQIHYQSSSDDEANASAAAKRTVRYDLPRNSVDSGLPSAFDVFSQVGFILTCFLFISF